MRSIQRGHTFRLSGHCCSSYCERALRQWRSKGVRKFLAPFPFQIVVLFRSFLSGFFVFGECPAALPPKKTRVGVAPKLTARRPGCRAARGGEKLCWEKERAGAASGVRSRLVP
jgi:hypothetical protein